MSFNLSHILLEISIAQKNIKQGSCHYSSCLPYETTPRSSLLCIIEHVYYFSHCVQRTERSQAEHTSFLDSFSNIHWHYAAAAFLETQAQSDLLFIYLIIIIIIIIIMSWVPHKKYVTPNKRTSTVTSNKYVTLSKRMTKYVFNNFLIKSSFLRICFENN